MAISSMRLVDFLRDLLEERILDCIAVPLTAGIKSPGASLVWYPWLTKLS